MIHIDHGHVRLPIGEDAISLGHAAGSSNDEEAVVQRLLYEIDHQRSVVKDQGASRLGLACAGVAFDHHSAFIVLCDVLCLAPSRWQERSLSAVIADPRISPPDGGLMSIVAGVLVALVAALHLWFLVLEMLLWQKPIGMRTFGLTPERAELTAALAANQGLYNGFLAAGLVVGMVATQPSAFHFKLFFLVCVIVAGLFGAATVSRRILIVQALPAALALVAVLAAGG